MKDMTMEKDKRDKIAKYNFEEIEFILFILASELSKYSENELNSFNEAIEGRIEVLFKREFLLSFGEKYSITDNIILNLEALKELVINLYNSQWMEKLLKTNLQMEIIRSSSNKILKALKIEYCDPKKFSEEHLNIDW